MVPGTLFCSIYAVLVNPSYTHVPCFPPFCFLFSFISPFTGMDVAEAVELIRAARPDLKKIIRVPEVGRLMKCRQLVLSNLAFSHPL